MKVAQSVFDVMVDEQAISDMVREIAEAHEEEFLKAENLADYAYSWLKKAPVESCVLQLLVAYPFLRAVLLNTPAEGYIYVRSAAYLSAFLANISSGDLRAIPSVASNKMRRGYVRYSQKEQS